MTRTYRAPERELAAAQTRSRILATAHELLLRGGPAAMTVVGLAGAARVSPQTVYNSVGGKAAVIKAVYDVLLAGDDAPTPMSSRPAFRAVIDARDAAAYAVAYAAWTGGIYARVGRLLGVLLAEGPGGDAVLVEFVSKINGERRMGNRNGLTGLVERGLLPAGEPLERVIDGVWVLTAPEVYDRLVHQREWPNEDYVEWLAAQLRAVLQPHAILPRSRPHSPTPPARTSRPSKNNSAIPRSS
jgi:AcrR family transcriptional regulator